MQILRKSKDSNNYLATLAVGEKHHTYWEKFALPGWLNYCERFDLGLIVFDNLLYDHSSSDSKKINWQKLLIGDSLSKQANDIENVLYLDTDILISPLSPNVFNEIDQEKISLVSQVFNLPYDLEVVLRRLAFLRHNFWDKKYPLDSALFMSPQQIFKYHSLPSFDNYTCTGFFIFNLKNHGQLLKEIFFKYTKNIQSLTGGGEEPHLNYELQSYGKIKWLDYKYQALWTYEIAYKYPFLFEDKYRNHELVISCIESSLYSNYFLHFAGSWHESNMWKQYLSFSSQSSKELIQYYEKYLQQPITGESKGIIKP